MKSFVLRQIGIADVALLHELAVRTFVDAFAAVNDPMHMQAYLNQQLSIETLTAELQEPDSMFFVAEKDSVSIGYLKLNVGNAQLEFRQENGIEIERLYVLQDWHGKGVAQFLMDAAIEIAKTWQKAFIWLGVWEQNHRALAFYAKYGFEQVGTHIFMLGEDAQTDLLLRRYL